MKNLTYFIFVLLFGIEVSAQVPQSFRYQAVARDNSGNILANQPVNFRISILSGTVSGTAVYSETHTSISTNAFGLVELEIGKGTSETGTFSAIDWGSNLYFVKIEMDPEGGTAYQVLITSQLLSVPYALHAKTAETANDAVKITGDQTIEGNKTFNGKLIVGNPVYGGQVTNKLYVDSRIKDLIDNLKIYIGISDIDGNKYNMVKIGTQLWMVENLKTTKYNDGTSIPKYLAGGKVLWDDLKTPAYCWYNGDALLGDSLGALYNGFAVNTGKLCPKGWHVPSNEDWTTLQDYLINNGFNYDGTSGSNKIAKSLASLTGWNSSTVTGAVGNTDFPTFRNKTGFSGLPGGFIDSRFRELGAWGTWWSTTAIGLYDNYMIMMIYNNASVKIDRSRIYFGYSVRCICDE